MTNFRIRNTGSEKLFKSPVLEKLSRTCFVFPVVLYFIIAIASLAIGFFSMGEKPVRILFLFPAGMIFFSLVEYLIHRFLFHFPTDTDKKKKIQYTIHGVHHAFPKDRDRLAMPPVISVLLATFFFLIFLVTMQNNAWYFYAGFVAGYSVYLLIHFAVHRFRPPHNFFRILWKHHALHHYKDMEGNYSVSFPLWDYIFGSASVARNDSARQ